MKLTPSVQTFVGGIVMMLAGKYLLGGIDVKVPGIDTPLDVAAMVSGFGACMWALKHPTQMLDERKAKQEAKRQSSAPPAP